MNRYTYEMKNRKKKGDIFAFNHRVLTRKLL